MRGRWQGAAVAALVLAGAEAAAAQQVRVERVSLEDFHEGEHWPFEGAASRWWLGEQSDGPLPESRRAPAAAVCVTADFRFVLADFALEPGARGRLDLARASALYLDAGTADHRAAARLLRAIRSLDGPASNREEARAEIRAAGAPGWTVVQVLRLPELWDRFAETIDRMAERHHGERLAPERQPRNTQAARALALALEPLDLRLRTRIQGELAELARPFDASPPQGWHLAALTRALAPWKGKQKSLVLCLDGPACTVEAALQVQAALTGFALTYGFRQRADDAERRAAVELPFEFRDDRAWAMAGGPILQVLVDRERRGLRFVMGGASPESGGGRGLAELFEAKLPAEGCPALRLDAPWELLGWEDFLNIVVLATSRRVGLVVGKRNPPKPRPAPKAAGKAAAPKGFDALQKQQPALAARLVDALADLRSGEPARLAAGLAAYEGAAGGDAPLVAAVGPLLDDPDPFVRAGAVAALAANPQAGLAERLASRLRDASAMVRSRAAEALADLGDAAAVPAVLDALTDRDALTRELAAFVLEAVGDPRGAEPLAPLLADASPAVRAQALAALAACAREAALPRLAAGLADGTAGVCRAARAGLVTLGTPAAMRVVLDRIGAADVPDAELERLVGTLGWFGAPATVHLARLLADRREPCRNAAQNTLWDVPETERLPALVQAVQELAPGTETDDLSRAFGALDVALARTAVPTLVAVMKQAADHRRAAAAKALANVEDPAVIQPLIDVLRAAPKWADHARVRIKSGLGLLGEPVIDPAIEALLGASGAARLDLDTVLLFVTGESFEGDPAKWRTWRAAGGKAKPRRTSGGLDVTPPEPPDDDEDDGGEDD